MFHVVLIKTVVWIGNLKTYRKTNKMLEDTGLDVLTSEHFSGTGWTRNEDICQKYKMQS